MMATAALIVVAVLFCLVILYGATKVGNVNSDDGK
jgi:hypothetical protein